MVLTYLIESHDILEAGASCGDHHTSIYVFAQLLAQLRGLGQLPGLFVCVCVCVCVMDKSCQNAGFLHIGNTEHAQQQ